MGVEGAEKIVDGEAGGVGVGQHSRGKGAQAPVVLARRMSLRRRRAYEGADSAPGLNHTRALELAVHPGDGVRVHPQVHGQLTDGRQLIAWSQAAGGNRRTEATLDLCVDRSRVPRVDGDDAHVTYCTSSIGQLLSSLQASSLRTGNPTW